MTFQQQLFAEEKKSLSLEAAAKETQTFLEESRTRVEDLTAELEKLQLEVVAMKALPQHPKKGAVEDSSVVVAQRAEIARLQGEKDELVLKFNTTEDRYKSGDLVRSPLSHFSCPLTDSM